MSHPSTTTEVTLPTGYTMRPATVADAEAIAAMANIAGAQYSPPDQILAEDIISEYNRETYDTDIWTRVVLSPEGDIVAFIELYNAERPLPVGPWFISHVHPAHTNKGIGTALLAWVEALMIDNVIPRCPADAKVELLTGVRDGYTPAEELFTNSGYQPTRYFWDMLIDFSATAPEQPQVAEGFTIRAPKWPEESQALVYADRESFRDHFGFVDNPLEEIHKEFMDTVANDEAFDPALFRVAIEDATGELVGFAINRTRSWENPEAALLDALGVRREWRKRGLGKALLLTTFNLFYDMGHRQVTLGVDAINPTGATRLYEGAGMKIHKTTRLFAKTLRDGVEYMNQAK